MEALPPIEEVRARVNACGNVTELARRSGVPYRTVVKVASGESDRPGYETVRALIVALDAMKADVHG